MVIRDIAPPDAIVAIMPNTVIKVPAPRMTLTMVVAIAVGTPNEAATPVKTIDLDPSKWFCYTTQRKQTVRRNYVTMLLSEK